MKPGKPIEGVKGDCLRMCVAAIMEVSPRRVPHFVRHYDNDWCAGLEKWLSDRGYTLWRFSVKYCGGLAHRSVPKGYWIAVVDNERFDPDTAHAIVMKGRRVAYDPYPNPDAKRHVYHSGYEITPPLWLGIPDGA